MLKRIVVLISGSGTNLQAIIDACEQKVLEAQVVGVVSNRANAYGLERAKKHEIQRIVLSQKQRNIDLYNALEAMKPDLIVLAGYLSILDDQVTEKYENKIINVHPSLIPKYAGKGYYGMKVHEAVVNSKEKMSGATVHYVDQGVDTGKIIMQQSVVLSQDETPESLQKKVLEIEHELLIESIGRCLKGEV